MRFLVLALALAMPLVGWLSNTGLLGPTNGEISNRYPTLIVAAGYAFAIWGPIFLLDVVFGIAQASVREPGTRLQRIRVLTAAGFALTSLWMVVFTLQWFWLALAIIWGSLWCLLGAAWLASRTRGHRRGPWWQWLPLSLHAGWVSLAVFLNVAQVVVAFKLLSVERMLPWTLVLFALAGLLLLAMVVKLRGNPWYTLAAVWGLLGVHAKQQASALSGADTAANVAMAMAVLVALTALIAALLGQRGARAPRAG
ncbi:MAG: hypothetical protein KGL91_09855 [Xanthomonadaceae bacterium]|nr:hypothetical protein [Xanthomonadaceae bacterium]